MSKPKRKRSIIVRLLVICLSAYMITTLIGLWRNLNEKKKELSELNTQLNVKTADVEELKVLLSTGSEQEIVEKAARQRLGYVYSNEEIYIDISGN